MIYIIYKLRCVFCVSDMIMNVGYIRICFVSSK